MTDPHKHMLLVCATVLLGAALISEIASRIRRQINEHHEREKLLLGRTLSGRPAVDPEYLEELERQSWG